MTWEPNQPNQPHQQPTSAKDWLFAILIGSTMWLLYWLLCFATS